MTWTRNGNEWNSGLFRIVKRFRFFSLYFNKNFIGQFPSLEAAQEKASKTIQNG